MVGIASAATAVVIGYVAAGTRTIRVGAGGIMLPNHAPLVVAEQFGTLESLYPGRIDLGLGRAPGTDQHTVRALRREPGADSFPQDVLELQAFFGPVQEGQTVQAVPGAGLNVPLWILGSSLFGAQLAAMLGLPYAFASHFAPAALLRRCQRIAARSSHRSNSIVLTRRRESMSSSPIPMRKRAGSSRPPSSSSPISSAAHPAGFSHPSTTSKPTGRRRRRRRLRPCSPVHSLVRPKPCATV